MYSHQLGWGRTYLGEGTGHPASQLPAGRALHSSLAAQGWFQLWGKGSLFTPTPAQTASHMPQLTRGLTLWRRCVGPAPTKGELPGQSSSVLSVGWGRRTSPCKAQGAGAA